MWKEEREGEMCNYIVISKNKRNNNKKECVRKIVRAQGMPSGTRNMVRGQRSPVKRRMCFLCEKGAIMKDTKEGVPSDIAESGVYRLLTICTFRILHN